MTARRDNDGNPGAKRRLQAVRTSNEHPETNPLHIQWAPSRTLPRHSWPLARARESADLPISRPKREGPLGKADHRGFDTLAGADEVHRPLFAARGKLCGNSRARSAANRIKAPRWVKPV